jgi:NADPH:quinone reductase-like Zn-dependent oxidoreductase
MKEVVITKYGPPKVLQIREREIPTPKKNQVLVRNHFTGINFSEIMARMHLYPGAPKPPARLGSEACGIIESVGEEVKHFKPGDKVMLFCRFCSYSTHIIVNEEMTMHLPNNFSLKEGAAFPIVYVTAYMMIFDLGNLRKRETILIHNAGGGVGTAAVQLVHTIGGNIIGTASKWKHKKLNSMGVINCIDYNYENVFNKVMEFTEGKGVDLIIDPIGGDNWKISYKCLSPMGSIIRSTPLPSVNSITLLKTFS